MSERKYSLKEIDQMRSDVRTLAIRGFQTYGPGEAAAIVEDQLRTYMQNGTDPDELNQAAMAIRLARAEKARL